MEPNKVPTMELEDENFEDESWLSHDWQNLLHGEKWSELSWPQIIW